jgi:hypothetical protein
MNASYAHVAPPLAEYSGATGATLVGHDTNHALRRKECGRPEGRPHSGGHHETYGGCAARTTGPRRHVLYGRSCATKHKHNFDNYLTFQLRLQMHTFVHTAQACVSTNLYLACRLLRVRRGAVIGPAAPWHARVAPPLAEYSAETGAMLLGFDIESAAKEKPRRFPGGAYAPRVESQKLIRRSPLISTTSVFTWQSSSRSHMTQQTRQSPLRMKQASRCDRPHCVSKTGRKNELIALAVLTRAH